MDDYYTQYTSQNSSASLLPDSHHCSDFVHCGWWRNKHTAFSSRAVIYVWGSENVADKTRCRVGEV